MVEHYEHLVSGISTSLGDIDAHTDGGFFFKDTSKDSTLKKKNVLIHFFFSGEMKMGNLKPREGFHYDTLVPPRAQQVSLQLSLHVHII